MSGDFETSLDVVGLDFSTEGLITFADAEPIKAGAAQAALRPPPSVALCQADQGAEGVPPQPAAADSPVGALLDRLNHALSTGLI